MRENKSPDVRARAGEKEEARVTSSYPAEPVAVNTCDECAYTHGHTARRPRGFCLFTGEPLDDPCEHFTATAGGAI